MIKERTQKKRSTFVDKNVEPTVSPKKEEEVPEFVGSEFRKREVLFQPKKKKKRWSSIGNRKKL